MIRAERNDAANNLFFNLNILIYFRKQNRFFQFPVTTFIHREYFHMDACRINHYIFFKRFYIAV